MDRERDLAACRTQGWYAGRRTAARGATASRTARHGGGGARRGPSGSGAPAAPDPSAIVEAERQISNRGRFAGKAELLAALPASIDSARLDRILDYLASSAKISMDGEAVSWTFNGCDGPREDSSAGKRDCDSSGATAATEDTVHILSMEERLSPDLDNDLPYGPEIERAIADCEAGRPVGTTYTVKEYLQELDREFGDDAVGRPAD